MTVLALGLRLARAGGLRRAGLVAAGVALGTVVLLVAAAVPATLRQPSTETVRLTAIVIVALAVPVVTLLAAVVRLSATLRDRRLASLRILGVSAAATRAAAAVEALTLAASGVLVGVALFLVSRPAIQAADPAGQPWFHGRPLWPGPVGWTAVPAGVLLVCAVVAFSPAAAVTRSPVGTRHEASAPRPRLWRCIPLALGLAALGYVIVRSPGAHASVLITPFLAGTVLAGVGLPLAAPVATRWAADAVARHATRPALVLAARRAQQEPAASTRIVSTLLVALFVLVGARCVLVAFETTPQAERAHHALTDGPQGAVTDLRAGQPVDLAALRAVPGVRSVAVVTELTLGCTPLQAKQNGGGLGAGLCGTAVVGTCADLPALRITVAHCADGALTWILPPWQPLPADQQAVRSAPVVVGHDDELHVTARHRLPKARDIVQAEVPADDPNWGWESGPLLLIPPDTPGLARFERDGQRRLSAVFDGGPAALARFTRAAAVQQLTVFSGADYAEWRTVERYLALLWAMTATLLSLGLAALLFTAFDRAAERRRHVAALAVIGVPLGVSRRSQLLQTAAPLVFGLPAAAGCGLLAGCAYLALQQTNAGTPVLVPIGGLFGLLGVAVAGAGAVAAVTVVGLGRRVRATDLRRE